MDDRDPLDTSWPRLWRGLHATGDGAALRERLVALYGEAARHYHTLQHLRECLRTFDAASQLAPHRAEVEAGLWFHDAIYDPRRTDNEQRSAELAQQALTHAQVAPDAVARVVRLVLATRHTAVPADPDEQLLVDIDLAILGAPEPRFAEYEQQIRAEYAFVPETVFRDRRRAILQSFLARPSLYGTEHFRGLLELRARLNLARAVAADA